MAQSALAASHTPKRPCGDTAPPPLVTKAHAGGPNREVPARRLFAGQGEPLAGLSTEELSPAPQLGATTHTSTQQEPAGAIGPRKTEPTATEPARIAAPRPRGRVAKR